MPFFFIWVLFLCFFLSNYPSDASKVETSDKDKIKFTKNNFIQSTKQLISLGLTIDELQSFITSKISESSPTI